MLRKPKPHRKPLCLEVLEDRLCLSVTNPALVFDAQFTLKGVNHRDLFITTANGAAAQQLTNDNLIDAYPVWAPDGTRIAFVRQQTTSTNPSAGGIYTIKADGTGLTLLYDLDVSRLSFDDSGVAGGGTRMDWLPDGRKYCLPRLGSQWSVLKPLGPGCGNRRGSEPHADRRGRR